MTTIKVRLSGAPIDKFTREFTVPEFGDVLDLKSTIRKEFKLHDFLVVNLIFRGKVLVDHTSLSLIPFKEGEMLVLMAVQAGG